MAPRPLLTTEEVWRLYDEIESRVTAPLSERMLDLAGLRPGMRVLDLATGRGEPALRAARRVGPEGLVIGVEIAPALLQMTREKAAREDLRNLDLRGADAETFADLPPAHVQAVTVRWGLMYMNAPVFALTQARRALAPGGVLVAALWAEPERVPYFTLPRQLLSRYRTVPPIDPEVPGTFRYADLDRLRRDLGRAGFTITHIEEMDIPVFEADTAEDVVAWVRALGLTRLLNELPDSDQRAWEHDLMLALEQHRDGGRFRLGGVTCIVVAC